jgi:hypothetical protein
MFLKECNGVVRVNWTAIFSYACSLAFSLVIWAGVIRTVEHFVR